MKQGESLESIVSGDTKLLIYADSLFKLRPAFFVTFIAVIEITEIMVHIRLEFKSDIVSQIKCLFRKRYCFGIVSLS